MVGKRGERCAARIDVASNFTDYFSDCLLVEISASIWILATRRWSVERERMSSISSFSSRILERDLRPFVGPSTRLLIGTSRAAAMRINVSSEGSACARSKLLRLAELLLMRSARASWVRPFARRAALIAAAICSLWALSMSPSWLYVTNCATKWTLSFYWNHKQT